MENYPMGATMENPPQAAKPWSPREVETIRGQYHKFMLIPLMEQYTTWFNGGLVSIAVESRALGASPERMVRGPSIHVFNALRTEEYLRFDVFGTVLHYHYILNEFGHNILWGYDSDTNGPMLPWIISVLRHRLPLLLRRAGAHKLAAEVEAQGWNAEILTNVERVASEALAPRDDDLTRAREGLEWMKQWKSLHPQFNTVEEGRY
jgi:hypothetical protein